jgi:hypothetical protein
MRFLGVLLVLLALAGSASAAPFKHVADGVTSAPVANAPGEIVAYLKGPGKVIVRSEPGSLSERTVPDGCVPAAASSHSVALDCYDASGRRESVLVDDLVTGEKTAIGIDALPAGGPLGTPQEPHVIDVGRHWVHVGAAGAPGAGGHQLTDQFLVGLGGEQGIDLADDPFGADRIFNLTRTPPARRLCKAAHRYRGGDGVFAQETFGTTRGFGHWVLATVNNLKAELTNCRTERHRTITGPVVLNPTHMASVARNGGDYEVVLTRLQPRRVQRFAVSETIGPAPLLALSRNVLWVVTGSGELLKKKL